MFDKYFEVFLADTLEAQKIHYHIRYQVYCEELGYEDPTQFPDQLEFDKWDPMGNHISASKLFLVRLRHTKQWIGAMRLVPYNGHALPLEETTSLDHPIKPPSLEVSRLCLVKEIRKPYTQNAYGIDESDTLPDVSFENNNNDQVTLFYSNPKIKSTIIWGLFNAAMQYSQANNIKKWYLLSNKALLRLISRQGFTIEQVGSTCEHRGQRSPYRFDVDEIATNPIWNNFKKPYYLYSERLEQTKVSPLKMAN